MEYGKLTKEGLKEIIEDIFKKYKDPTKGMTLKQKILFHKALKEQAKGWTY